MNNRNLCVRYCVALAALLFQDIANAQDLLVKGGLTLQGHVATRSKNSGAGYGLNDEETHGGTGRTAGKKMSVAASQSAKDGEQTQKKDLRDSEKDIYQWFQTYSEVISLVEKKSFRAVDFSKFIQDSLKAAVAQIDAHSAFFTRDSYKAAMESTSGEFSGIGVSVISKTPEDEALVVVDVIQNGPSEKAGLKGGDKIIEINGEKLRGLSSDEVVNKLKGKVGSVVRVKIMRSKKPIDFKVVRDIIKDQTSLCYRFKDQNIYYLSLKIFNEIAAQQVEDLLKKANDGKCKGILLDLRRNPGGTMDSAIDMAGLFLKKGSLVVSTKNRYQQRVSEYKTNRDPILKSDAPIFILVDNFTASAAEILAGALQYHSMNNGTGVVQNGTQKKDGHKNLMVFLIGTPTFGKGSVQELIPVKNGCALKVTIMLYYLPSDESIQARGINPDFTIKPKFVPVDEIKWINELYGKETALKNYITVEEVTGKKKKYGKKKKGFWGRLFGSKNDEQEVDANVHEEANEEESDDVTPGEVGENKGKKKNWEEEQREGLALDIQVQASVNMINLLDLAKKSNPMLVQDRGNALKFLQTHYLTDDPTKIEKIQ